MQTKSGRQGLPARVEAGTGRPGAGPRGNAALDHRMMWHRPLLGLTMLMVEDSRTAAEAVRLMCLQSGARLRWADGLQAARRHLATYRPDIVLIDLGLPDGSGTELIAEIAAARPPAPVILATSGGEPAECTARALAAGADGFLPKPPAGLMEFQANLLAFLPDRPSPDPGRVRPLTPAPAPDPAGLAADLERALRLLRHAAPETRHYCAQFLDSLAQGCRDPSLHPLAVALRRDGRVAPIRRRLRERLDALRAIRTPWPCQMG